MDAFVPPVMRRLGLATALTAALAGCSTLEVKQPTVQQTATIQQGPEARPHRSITGFSAALRCMDNLMIDHGVRDVSMLVEEIVDQTKKVNAGTRDMLITAVSDMTRRSRAVRLVAYGRDAGNVISFLQSAQRQSAYEVIPEFDIKGSVTQLDESVIRTQKDLGIGYQPFLNLGLSRDAASSILGLDLSVLLTEDMSILPGVTSRNSVVILKQGKGNDGDAAYHKFGISYSMNLSRSEGQTQALRGLVELAVIELMGKLTKIPYWRCLGGDASASEEIRHEMADWYYAMAASRAEIVAYFQNQLRRRGFYDGPVDGKFNDAIDEALAAYRAELGLSREAAIDEALFTTYLNADHSKVARPPKPFRHVEAPADATPLALAVSAANGQTRFARGEAIKLSVKPSRDAHVVCYLQDEAARITRFFPNRFSKDSFVSAAKPVDLPGKGRFEISMNRQGVKETVACFATPRDVLAQLPANVVGVDLEPLAVQSLEQLRSAFVKAAGETLAQEEFHVQAR
jgi:curli biogenesis system outer membrane secretion channel CsgG